MNEKDIWLTPKQIRAKIGISDSTLRRWANEKKVKFITPTSNHRLYHYGSIVGASRNGYKEGDKRITYCYCRVSSIKQNEDLTRQKQYMQQQFPDATVVSDIGSGINWRRPNFCKLVDDSINGKVEKIIVAHRDLLCRFGFELLEQIFKICKVQLMVLDKDEQKSSSDELAEDLLSIIHVFNCKQMGKRRYGTTNTKCINKIQQQESQKRETEEASKETNKENSCEKTKEKTKENTQETNTSRQGGTIKPTKNNNRKKRTQKKI